jgi:hypothetical protein
LSQKVCKLVEKLTEDRCSSETRPGSDKRAANDPLVQRGPDEAPQPPNINLLSRLASRHGHHALAGLAKQPAWPGSNKGAIL